MFVFLSVWIVFFVIVAMTITISSSITITVSITVTAISIAVTITIDALIVDTVDNQAYAETALFKVVYNVLEGFLVRNSLTNHIDGCVDMFH